MTTMFMADESGLYLAPPNPARASPEQSASAMVLRHVESAAVRLVRQDGDTARGKPPPVSARFVVGLQWALFAACAVRILLLAP